MPDSKPEPIQFKNQPPRVRRVLEICAEDYAVSVGEILGPSQSRQVSRARCKAIHILRDMKFSENEIGRFVHKNHTSVHYAIQRRIFEMDEPGPELQELTEQQIEAAVWDLWVARFSLGKLNHAATKRGLNRPIA